MEFSKEKKRNKLDELLITVKGLKEERKEELCSALNSQGTLVTRPCQAAPIQGTNSLFQEAFSAGHLFFSRAWNGTTDHQAEGVGSND